MLKHWVVGILASGLIAFSGWSASRGDSPSTAPAGLRVGVYDPRAIAVAYAHSDFFAKILQQHKADHDAAKAAGDQKRVKELEAWGESQQIRAHLQVFGGAPVDDCLDKVRDRLPQVAQTAGVQVITRKTDYADAGAEVVDVTDDLVQLFNPDAKTLRIIEAFKKQPLIPLEQVAKMGVNE